MRCRISNKIVKIEGIKSTCHLFSDTNDRKTLIILGDIPYWFVLSLPLSEAG